MFVSVAICVCIYAEPVLCANKSLFQFNVCHQNVMMITNDGYFQCHAHERCLYVMYKDTIQSDKAQPQTLNGKTTILLNNLEINKSEIKFN